AGSTSTTWLPAATASNRSTKATQTCWRGAISGVSSVIPTPTGRARVDTFVQSTIDPQEQGRPDVDLTDGAFYAGDSRSVYKWMRVNEPVFATATAWPLQRPIRP